MAFLTAITMVVSNGHGGHAIAARPLILTLDKLECVLLHFSRCPPYVQQLLGFNPCIHPSRQTMPTTI